MHIYATQLSLFAGAYSKMNNLCLSLLVLAALLVPACTQLSNVRMFMKDSDLNKRFRGTEHVFKCKFEFCLYFPNTIIQWNLSKTATFGPVLTDLYREVAAQQRLVSIL